jgi:polysaccharide pyruvyl transferase WcaK-like protein
MKASGVERLRKSMKPLRISLYGHFGAGNLGNECTLQAVIEAILQRRPDAQLQCLCTYPEDVRQRHRIPALHSSMRGAAESSPFEPRTNQTSAAVPAPPAGPAGKLKRLRRLSLEFIHWVRMLRAIWRTEMLIVAGTGIVADYMCGPLGWPYDIFKLSILAKLCRVKLVFLSVGAGPITHPLSRWFIKTSLRLADYRSYRDEASRRYLAGIGFSNDRDAVYPDVVFGLYGRHLVSKGVRADRRRVVGLGLKDYSGVMGQLDRPEYRRYLDTMAALVSWLCEHDFSVRILIGDFQFDSRVREEFVDILRSRNLPAEPSRLIVEPALTVDELLRQMAETDIVISPRYHNLVLAMILDKPVMALSDHAKLDSLLTDVGLAQYLMPLDNLRSEDLSARFEQLNGDAERVRSYIRKRLENYSRALDEQYALLLAEPTAP